jgi:phosphoenolpyruvate carboxylase
LSRVVEHLTLSGNDQVAPPTIVQGIDRLTKETSIGIERVLYREVPWRQFAFLVQKKVQQTLQDQGYRSTSELRNDLVLLSSSLDAVGATRIARTEVWPVIRIVDVFGFHGAVLDIRQNSQFHDQAIAQLLAAAGIIPPKPYSEQTQLERLPLLLAELNSRRPFLAPDVSIGAEADAVLSCYRVLKEYRDRFGLRGIGSLIVSMTRGVADLFAVYLFVREVGLWRETPDGPASEIHVVPLFETIEDLEAAPAIVTEYIEHPFVRRSLNLQAEIRGSEYPVQQIMLGYSDSNKDSGIFTSQWALHRAQKEITKVADLCGIQVRYFHGRGGTISRGAGPTHRFLEALPHKTIKGDVRLTEQGETIAQKYANRITAAYNLEILVAGVSGITLRQRNQPEPLDRTGEIASELSEASRNAYRNLLNHPKFIDFFRSATPIDALELSSIGSRPSRRTGQHTLTDLRAIPWVFSWTQSRYYLPGWFGIGTALQALEQDETKQKLLLDLGRSSSFLRFVLTNAETNICSASASLMEMYASLCPDDEGIKDVYTLIKEEFDLTHKLLSEVLGGASADRRPRFTKTLEIRADGLRALHVQQVGLLRTWREAMAAGAASDADRLFADVMVSINAVASGLRTTG